MERSRIRVGIVGLQPGKSWAATAHIPALRAMSDDYEVVAVANRTEASARAVAAAFGIPRSFASAEALVACPEVDVVAVTVRVPHHRAIVVAALEAGKHVYCEWPLGNGLAEARELAALARGKGVRAVVGTQARVAPELEYVRDLVASGYLGELLSTTLIGNGGTWGAVIDQASVYLLDRASGASLLTIPFGHTMAAVADALGEVVELSATLTTRRSRVRIAETGELVAMTAADQVLVDGTLASGAPIAVHYRGGMPRGTGLLWEINGTEGDLQITGLSGHAQMGSLTLMGARGEQAKLERLEVPAKYAGEAGASSAEGVARNVARMYARLASDLRKGTHLCPTFDDAVGTHRLIAAVEQAAHSGHRVRPDSL